MRGRHRRWVAGLCIALLAVSTGGSATAFGASATADRGPDSVVAPAPTLSQSSDDDTIDQTQTYALTPNRPGSVRVTLTYELPDRVTRLEAAVPGNATVTDTDGFDAVNETTYEWDESTETATIVLRYNPNETTERTGPEAAGGDYLFVDAGDWALFDRIQTSATWAYTGRSGDDPVTFERSVTTDGPGATGDELVYLGAVSTTERTANGQTFRLVVPERAALTEPADEILDSLENASSEFDIGSRDEAVFVVAAPTDEIAWGVRGLEYGGSDMFVRDVETLDDPANVWLHEYVHTRQSFSTERETRWLTEGTAVYYAALLTLEQDRIDFATFERFLDDGERTTYDDAVLADPPTWAANANYVKGGLVAGRIDEAIREETVGTATFEETMATLNAVDGRVTQAAFLTAVEDAGGTAAREVAVEYTETAAPVSMWTDSTHSRLFGPLPASVDYALANTTVGYRISGPYRTDTVESTPITLATDETLTVAAVVTNTGDVAGEYNATLTVDGRVVANETGTVDADGELTVPLSHTFGDPGTYTVGVGDEAVTVTVERPAAPTVTTLLAASEGVALGENTTVTAMVENDAAVPANGTVVLTRNGEPVAGRAVALAPGNSTQLSVSVAFPDAGQIQVAAGAATPVTVTVFVPTASPAAGDTATASPAAGGATTGGDGPGFSALLALCVAVLSLLLAVRYHPRR